MTREHWLFLLAIALFVGLLLAFSLMHRPQSRGYRWIQRCFWSFVFLQGCGLMGWVGLNPATWTISALLGWPGCAALLALAVL